MIRYTKGDIFDSGADCIVNTVNCDGYMGKGIAYQFKKRYPNNNIKYEEVCRARKLRPGQILPYVENGTTIINFPTKDEWRKPSKMEYIQSGLDALIKELPKLSVKTIALPPLGCGNGGLDWQEVKNLIEKKLANSEYEFLVFEPGVVTSSRITEQQMSESDLALLYIRKELHRPTSLRFQKTLYFTNYYYGKDLFHFSRGKYGPYSKDLYNAAELIGKYQKQNGLSDTDKTFEMIYYTICSKTVDSQYEKIKSAAIKALAVVNDMQDDYILEGAATAFYLLKDEKKNCEDQLLEEFANWSEDKAARFKRDSIIKCLEHLEKIGVVERNIFGQYEVIKP